MTIRPFEGNELLRLADRLRNFFVGRDEVVWRAADVYSSVVQSIPGASALTALTFNSVRQDTDDMFNLAQPTRLTVKVAGWYVCSGHCRLGSAGVVDSERILFLRVNGASIAGNNYFPPRTTDVSYMSVSRVIFLNANDYLELAIVNSAAGAINTTVTNYSPLLALCRYP